MNNNNIIKILICVILILILILIIKMNMKKDTLISTNATNALNTLNTFTAANTNIQTQTEPKTVHIMEHKIEKYSINGIVKNNTNKMVKKLKITADYYDKDNNKLGSTLDVLEELNPGETWKFNMMTNSKAVKYKNLKLTYE